MESVARQGGHRHAPRQPKSAVNATVDAVVAPARLATECFGHTSGTGATKEVNHAISFFQAVVIKISIKKGLKKSYVGGIALTRKDTD